jgi:hypothetical protein
VLIRKIKTKPDDDLQKILFGEVIIDIGDQKIERVPGRTLDK